jgi:hypothetical protein
MHLPPVKQHPIAFHFMTGDRLTRSTKALGRLNNNLAKLTGLGILLSKNIQGPLAGTDQLHPIFSSVLGRISLQKCRSAQEAVAMINRNLPSVLAKAEVLPGQKLPKQYVLQGLPSPTPDYKYLLEVELRS